MNEETGRFAMPRLASSPPNDMPMKLGVSLETNGCLRRFRSLTVSAGEKEKSEWTSEAVKKKYSAERTLELYDFMPEFETGDLNQLLEPYQHHRHERGGYRIKWLNDTRALVVFRRADIATVALQELQKNMLLKAKPYNFCDKDLLEFNRKFIEEAKTKIEPEVKGGSAYGFQEELIRCKYRPEVTIELFNFVRPLETADLLSLFSQYRREDNIVRIKWFNKNRAIAWFAQASLASQALDCLEGNGLVDAAKYVFSATDIKYFANDFYISNPTARIRSDSVSVPVTGARVSRRYTVSGSCGTRGTRWRPSPPGKPHGIQTNALNNSRSGPNSGNLNPA